LINVLAATAEASIGRCFCSVGQEGFAVIKAQACLLFFLRKVQLVTGILVRQLVDKALRLFQHRLVEKLGELVNPESE
jgi:hypothetical protein